ncbi:MAG: hypothetical protein N2510_02525 [Ignavibacteria bacterium]|nr:hypothetical protein [Ignavibacteria bacterium]
MKKTLIFLLSVFITYGVTHSQTNKYMVLRSSPSYTLQLNLNYNQSILELSGAYNDDNQSVTVYDGETFGADKGFGANLISKIALDNRGTFRLTQSISYNRLLTYTFGDKTSVADNGSATFNCFTGGLGIEYNFTPAYKFKVYFGTEINASLINGETRVWFENRFNPPPTDSSYKILNSFRGGFGLMAGGEYFVSDNFGLHLGVRLINANLIGKQAEGSNDDKEFKLRDAANPNLKFAGDKDKSFSFYSVMAGINFYFGVKTKKYKIN